MSLKCLSTDTSQVTTASDTPTVSHGFPSAAPEASEGYASAMSQTAASDGTAGTDQLMRELQAINFKDISVPAAGHETLRLKTTQREAYPSGGPRGHHWDTAEETASPETPATTAPSEDTSSGLPQTSQMAGDGRSTRPDEHETPLMRPYETYEQESPQPTASGQSTPPDDEAPPGTG